jgi:hypothetical protein
MKKPIHADDHGPINDWEIRQIKELVWPYGEMCKFEAKGISYGIIKKLLRNFEEIKKGNLNAGKI